MMYVVTNADRKHDTIEDIRYLRRLNRADAIRIRDDLREVGYAARTLEVDGGEITEVELS